MFEGSYVAIVTPFHEDQSINYEALTRLLEWHVSMKTDGIVILGTTGESPTLSKEEKLSVFKHTVKVIHKRIPVIAGTGSNNTMDTVIFSREVEKLGVDGLLVVTPYYNKGNPEGQIHHFTTIADSVNIPIILYNVPSRTGVELSIDTVLTLSKHPNIVAIKEASNNLSYIAELCSKVDDTFTVLSGNDDTVVPLLSLGGKGVISVAANIIPSVMHSIVEEFQQNNLVQARKLQLQYLPLIQSLFIEVNPIPVKYALRVMGFEVGGYRLPLYEMKENNKQYLETVLQGYNI